MNDVSYTLAFVAGLLSFLSPCVLPLVPAYLSFVTGLSLDDLVQRNRTARVIKRTVVFILGFSVIFIALGASSSFIGSLFLRFQDYLRIGGGILIIIFGLFISGILKLDFLMREKRYHFAQGPAGYIGVFVVGMGFSAGWTPCIGPILGTILIYAGSHAEALYGMKLLAVYSLGLAIPFIISALTMNYFLSFIKGIHRNFMRAVMLISGLILILFGVLMLTNMLGQLSGLFPGIDIKM